MTDLDPCLLGCDTALAEADRLMAMLSVSSESFDPELAAVRLRIARLRREVDRLRGMPTMKRRRELHLDWIELPVSGLPWPTGASESAAEG